MRRFVFLLLLGSSVCHAQDYVRMPVNHEPRQPNNLRDTLRTKSVFFSFNVGISVPLRDYGSKDTNRDFMIIGPDSTNGKGFANLGFHAKIDGGIFISPNFGLLAKIAYNSNSFDETTLNTILNGNYSYQINGNYNIWQFMGGAFANIQTDKTSSLWVQGMFGLIDANFPSFSLYYGPASAPLIINGGLTKANDLAYSFSIGYEKQISQNVGFLVTLSYTASELVYPTFTYSYTGPYTNLPPPYTQTTPVTMSFGSLDFSIGLLFHL